jgi:hypothetical protein
VIPHKKQLFRGRRRIVKSWHRYYDPTTGRYISADPIGLGGGLIFMGMQRVLLTTVFMVVTICIVYLFAYLVDKYNEKSTEGKK